MAFQGSATLCILALALLNISLFSKNFGVNADDDEFGGAGGGTGGGGAGFGGAAGAGAGGDSGAGFGGGSGGGGGAGFGGSPGGGLGGGGGAGFGSGPGGGAGFGGAGGGVADPGEIASEALLCFHDKYIYSSCEESIRLSEKGYLNVPPEKTEEFCDGPCASETSLVLNCVHNVFSDFLFGNKATINDIKATIKEGCGYGPERGDFNVAKHMQNYEGDSGHKAANIQLIWVFAFIILGHLTTLAFV